MRNGVLILECLDVGDPGSEGQFLVHMFNLMSVKAQYIEVRTKRQLLLLLDRPPFRMVHITTHGSVVERNSGQKPQFRGFWSPTEDLTLSDISSLSGKLSGRSVITTACMSAEKPFARRFVEVTGCQYYVAPKKSLNHSSAIYFAHLFYHKYYRRTEKYGRNIPRIVEDYDDKHTNIAQFVVTAHQS